VLFLAVGPAVRGLRTRYSLRMSRPLRAEIHAEALAANLGQARQFSPGARIWAVVKALGYGHGLDAVARGLGQADGLALVEFDAAARLRQLGYTGPMLMLEGPFDGQDVALACRLDLQLVIHSSEQIDWLEQQAVMRPVWIKVDTGMHRLGFDPQDVLPALERIRMLQARGMVGQAGLMTHFANADLPGGAHEALMRWERLRATLPATCASWPVSLSNSAALIDGIVPVSDWVRPGIMLYGASPFGYGGHGAAGRSAVSLGLRPAMCLRSQLIATRLIAAGEAVGYGSQFVAPNAMRVGVVACGYADGYPRHAPTGTPVLVAGQRTRIVGRVSMDMITVDLATLPQARVGSEVELWGDTVSVDEVAQAAGTIGYELLCAVSPRVPRVFV
jgi:alanine racemase